jgi:trans-aconitate methyltransferase
MHPKPAHLTPEHAALFQATSIVDAYPHRAPYPLETFDVLVSLMTDAPHIVLDAGTGTGKIARFLAPRVDRVDAVDWSAEMVTKGQQLEGGKHPHLRWICGRMEEVALWPPYALITAGESLHWMEWDVVFPRFAQVSTPQALLVIVERAVQPVAWWDEVRAVLKQYASYQAQSYDLVHEITMQGFFKLGGEHLTAPHRWCPSVASYLTSLHSQSSLSREALGAARLAAFDWRLKKPLIPLSVNGTLQMEVCARIRWGKVTAS